VVCECGQCEGVWVCVWYVSMEDTCEGMGVVCQYVKVRVCVV